MSQVFDKVMMYQAGFVTESLNEHRSNNKKCWGSSRVYFLSLSLYQYRYLWEMLLTCAQCWGDALPAAAVVFPVLGEFWEFTEDVRVSCEMSVCVGQERASMNPWSVRANPISNSSTPILGLQERCERFVQLPSARIPLQFPQCPWVSLWTGNFCFWQPWVGVVLL